MNNNDVTQVKKMLEALLKSQDLLWWVGGYVYGETSLGDPFIILYPASQKYQRQVCRVYQHGFKQLPSFIPTENFSPDIVGKEQSPDKDRAIQRGIYHFCPMFSVALHLGADTQMGPEKRFSSVLRVTDRLPAGAPTPQAPQPEPTPQPTAVDWPQKEQRPRQEAAGPQGDLLIIDQAVESSDSGGFFSFTQEYLVKAGHTRGTEPHLLRKVANNTAGGWIFEAAGMNDRRAMAEAIVTYYEERKAQKTHAQAQAQANLKYHMRKNNG